MATSGTYYEQIKKYGIKQEQNEVLAMTKRHPNLPINDLFTYAADNNRTTIVYVATNKTNGKQYVGVTRLSLEARKSRHEANARRGHRGKLYGAIRKHGSKVFVWEVISTHQTYKDALSEERKQIAERKPHYNMTAGGEGVLGIRHSEKTKKEWSRKRKGKATWAAGKCPDYVREKLKEAHKRRIKKPPTERQLAAYANFHKIGNARRRKPIRCNETGQVFESVTAVAAWLGVSTGHVVQWLQGTKPKSHSYTFSYVQRGG